MLDGKFYIKSEIKVKRKLRILQASFVIFMFLVMSELFFFPNFYFGIISIVFYPFLIFINKTNKID